MAVAALKGSIGIATQVRGVVGAVGSPGVILVAVPIVRGGQRVGEAIEQMGVEVEYATIRREVLFMPVVFSSLRIL